MMAKQKRNKSIKKQQIFAFAKHYRRALYLLIPVIVAGLYLNAANNHFYHRLHSAGLLWPQNRENYVVGSNGDPKVSYVALGDSLTAGVGAPSFEKSYAYSIAGTIANSGREVVVTPLATPGFKSKDIVEKHLDTAIALQPNIVTVLVGVNDVHGMSPSTKEFQNNYETIISRLKAETNASIYVVAIPYIGSDNVIWHPYSDYYGIRTKMFNTSIARLATKYGVSYVNLYDATLPYAHKSSSYYSKDDFHPSAEGYELWAKVIARDISN